ncbi:MAG: trypsin-like peptidase domain-containing protein [Chitinophagaceae bacterium]|nr:trypsin-like peptidase domain-containing protein [Chitinophagaceae bacterium]
MSEQPTPLTVIIRHTSGSKKGQIEKFPVGNDFQIRIGRGPDNNVSFDPVKEDTISREHCIIRLENFSSDTFQIIDSQSRNGSYVNGTRITEKTTIFAGDSISLGKDGPAMEFDVDPRPASHVKKTRVLDVVSKESATKETKVHEAGSTAQKAALPKEAIGKQTMQHMLQQSERKSKKGLWISILALLILGGTAGWLLYKRKPTVIVQNKITNTAPASTAMSVAQIAKANDNKVVYIEMGWKLILTQTGDQLFHVYLPIKEGGQSRYVACYVRTSQGAIEPYLATKSYAPRDASLEPIGGFGSGSGFVVDERGFIMTNRHVATSWLTSYHFPDQAFPGLLLEFGSKGDLVISSNSVSRGALSNWVPAEAMNYNRQLLESGIKGIDGELAYLDVTFANNSLRTPAKVVRISNTHDVAMIKIDLPEPLNKVTMLDNYKEIETGSVVVVMGYPGMSPDQFVANRSQDAFNRNPNVVKVPVPTVSTGNIGRLVKGSAGTTKVDEYLSVMGDYYQLTINSTGPGNSGGPMYDDQGRVIGIYSAGSEKMSYSIPIKYAIELMGRQAVIK